MRFLFIILMLTCLFSCNKKEEIIIDTNDTKIQEIENRLKINESLSKANEEKLSLQTQRLETLELNITTLNTQISSINDKIELLKQSDEDIEYVLENLQIELAEYKILQAEQHYRINLKLDRLEASIQLNNNKIAQLNQTTIDTISRIDDIEQQYNDDILAINSKFEGVYLTLDNLMSNISKVVYPCGPGNSKEILLSIENSYLVAYFVEKKNEYLSALEDGWYRTTDGWSCTFQVIGGEIVR